MEALVTQTTPLAAEEHTVSDSALNIFAKPNLSDNILSNDWVTFDRKTPLHDTTKEFSFSLPASSLPRYLDIKNIVACLKLSLVKKVKGEFKPVTAQDNVAVITNLLASFFASAAIRLNGGLIWQSPQHYSTISQLSKLLGDSKEARATYLELEVGGNDKDAFLTYTSNKERQARVEKFATPSGDTPKELVLVGNVPTSFESVSTLLANNSSLDITLVRQADEFLLDTGAKKAEERSAFQIPAGETYHLLVKDFSLHMKAPLVNDKIFTLHQKRFNNNESQNIYFYKDYSVVENIGMGVHNWTSQDLASTNKPLKLFCTFFSPDLLSGNYQTNSAVFKPPPNIKSAHFTMDGRMITPLNSLMTMDLSSTDSGGYQGWYRTLFEVTQQLGGMTPSDISFHDFRNHSFILALDNTTSGFAEKNKIGLLRQGAVRLHLSFSSCHHFQLHHAMLGHLCRVAKLQAGGDAIPGQFRVLMTLTD